MTNTIALTFMIVGCVLFVALISLLVMDILRLRENRRLARKDKDYWERDMMAMQEFRPVPNPKEGPIVHHLRANDLNLSPPHIDKK